MNGKKNDKQGPYKKKLSFHCLTPSKYPRPLKNYRKQYQPEITCSKLTIERLEQGVEYVQS